MGTAQSTKIQDLHVVFSKIKKREKNPS